jgi:hypothetical protein
MLSVPSREGFDGVSIESCQEQCPHCHLMGTYSKSAGQYFWRDVADVPNPDEPPPPAIDESQMARTATSSRFVPIEEAFLTRLTRGQPPDMVFHYTTAAGLLGIVKGNRLWASDVLYMNDATEVEYGRQLIVQVAESVATEAKSEMGRTLCKSIDTVLYPVGLVGGGFYAACFCEDGDLLSQWRGYAGGTGGYSLGFRTRDFRRWNESIPERRFTLRPVIYDPDEQMELIRTFLVSIDGALDELLDHLPDRAQEIHGVAYGTIQRQMLECMLTMKNPAFKEEREWRLIHVRSGFSREPEARVEYRPTRAFIVPYVALDITPTGADMLARVPEQHRATVAEHNRVPVAQVIVGPSAHPEAAAAAVRAMVRDLHLGADVINSRVPIRL